MKVVICENCDKEWLADLIAQNMKDGWEFAAFTVSVGLTGVRTYHAMMTKKERGPEPPRTKPVKL